MYVCVCVCVSGASVNLAALQRGADIDLYSLTPSDSFNGQHLSLPTDQSR